jgi:hypothetical protein
MIVQDLALLGIDDFNTLLVIADVEYPIKCLPGHFINARETVTSHSENTVNATTAGLEFINPVLLRIEALVVFSGLALRRGSHVFKLATVEDVVVELFRPKLLKVSKCICYNYFSRAYLRQTSSRESNIDRYQIDDTLESAFGFLFVDIVTVLQGRMGCSDKISHCGQSLLELLRIGNSKEDEFFGLLREARPDCVSSRDNSYPVNENLVVRVAFLTYHVSPWMFFWSTILSD